MINVNVNRWSGSALLVGSLLFILNKLDDMSRVFFNRTIPDLITGRDIFQIAVGQVLLVIGLLGCYLVYAKRSNRPGKIGLFLLTSGGILLALGHITFTPFANDDSPLFLLVILGVLLMVVGLVVFGIVNLRSHMLEFWQPLPLVTGLLGMATFFRNDMDQSSIVFLSLRTLFGMGLVLMGLVLWLDTRAVFQRVK